MAFDGPLLRAALAEVRAAMDGARVERVYQPQPSLLLLHLYHPVGGARTLLVSCEPGLARLHGTQRTWPNPAQPPVFCMVLRKHLLGRRLTAVQQEGWDRLVTLTFSHRSEPPLHLVLELAGPRPNAVLVDEQGRVVDALRRSAEGTGRPLHPHAPYVRPTLPTGWQPGDAPAALAAALAAAGPLPAWRALARALRVTGGDACRDLCLRAGLAPDAPLPAAAVTALAETAAATLVRAAAAPEPSAVRAEDRVAVAAWPLAPLAAHLGASLATYPTVAALADAVYPELEDRQQARALRDMLAQRIARERERAARRLAARLDDLAGTEDPVRLQQLAELLKAHLHQVPRGAAGLRVVDWYDPAGREVEIPLDPALPPTENLRRYFARYQRARRAAELAKAKAEEAREEVSYLESLAFALDQATDLSDLLALREELAQAGLLRDAGPGPVPVTARPATHPSGPRRVQAAGGWTILVGRNNQDNDRLTFRLAAPDDWWLHAKDVPGAHVVLKPPGGRPAEAPPQVLEDAAMLAAWFSRARQGANVPVDVTRCRHVRKPRGARPGMVVYEGHRTVWVTPDPERVSRLLAQDGRA